MCSQLSLHTGLGLGKSLLNSKLHFSAVGLLDGFMELFPAQTGQIWMSHEEEVAELHPAKCQSHYTRPQARILFGFCLCKDGGFPGLSGVAEFPMKCQMAAAAPGVELPAQTLCRAWQSAQSCSGQLCPQSKALGAPGWAQCPLSCVPIRHRAQEEFPFPGGSPHHFHSSTGHGASGMMDVEGRWSLVRSQRRKGRCHPGSSVQAQAVDPWEEDPTDSLRTFPYPSENPPR